MITKDLTLCVHCVLCVLCLAAPVAAQEKPSWTPPSLSRAFEIPITPKVVEVPLSLAHRNIRRGLLKCLQRSEGYGGNYGAAVGTVYPDLGEGDITLLSDSIAWPYAFFLLEKSGQGTQIRGWVNRPLFGEGVVAAMILAPLAAVAGDDTDCAKAGIKKYSDR